MYSIPDYHERLFWEKYVTPLQHGSPAADQDKILQHLSIAAEGG